MSTDYKNLFNKDKKKDYSNLFSDTKKEQPVRESNMAYKNLFGTEQKEVPQSTSTEPKKKYGDMFGKTKPSAPVFPDVQTVPELYTQAPKRTTIPERKVDPRIAVITAIDGEVPVNTVLLWLDNFEIYLSELGTNNQVLADEEVKLTQEFIDERSNIQDAFTGIKDILSRLKAPEKKKGILNKFFGSDEPEFIVTRDMVDTVIDDIRELINTHANKQKYGGTIFLKSKLDHIDKRIYDIKLNAQCAYVACKYLADKGDYKAEVRLDRIAKINQIIQISELDLQNSYKRLSLDLEKYEDLKQTTVPLLYIKLRNLLNNTLDPEAMNLINKIDELN